MSPFATPELNKIPKVHYSEYILTNNGSNDLGLATPHLPSPVERQRIDAIKTRISHKHRSFRGGVARLFSV